MHTEDNKTQPEHQEDPVESTLPRKKSVSETVQKGLKTLEEMTLPEEKIQIGLAFMRAALSGSTAPRFKDFWDMRTHCLQFFKAIESQARRTELWSGYVEISVEAKRLKEIVDEQAAFAAEQIELAVSSIEKEIMNCEGLLDHSSSVIGGGAEPSSTIKKNMRFYETAQRELNLLNAMASRVNSLRKEVIKTAMRIKLRTQFFSRLSILGDRVFPRRKELIKTISDQFIEDVATFVQGYFSQEDEPKTPPIYVLREEIKSLQGIAKDLTLSTFAFNSTRQDLSRCWDCVREWDKRRKGELASKKIVSHDNKEIALAKIGEIASRLSGEKIKTLQLKQEIQGVYDLLRTFELSREDQFFLREEVNKLLQVIDERNKIEECAKLEREEKAHKRVQNLLAEMRLLEGFIDDQDLELTFKKKQEIEEALIQETIGKRERMQLSSLERRIKDRIAKKKTASLLSLSSKDEKVSLELKEAFKEMQGMREEVKKNLEGYRKALGGSGFDFDKAMSLREMIDEDKERLAKLNSSLQELEEKIWEMNVSP